MSDADAVAVYLDKPTTFQLLDAVGALIQPKSQEFDEVNQAHRPRGDC
jgi:hypothetical protein